MRLQLDLDDELVARLDRRVGPWVRNRFIAEALTRALDDEHRWGLIESALGSSRTVATAGTPIRPRGCAPSAVVLPAAWGDLGRPCSTSASSVGD